MSQQSPIRIFTLITGAVCLASVLSGQTTEAPARFEVVDVHPSANPTSPSAYDMSGGLMGGGLYYLKRATMLDLIRIAYGVYSQRVIGGPVWLEVNRFDVRAKVPAGTTAVTVRPMLQALLAERFGLVVHNDQKPVPAWELTAGNHRQLKQSDGGASGCRVEPPSSGASEEASQLIGMECRNITMADFASHLDDLDGAWNYIHDNMVVDHTSLDGTWDFSFRYSRRNTGVNTVGAEVVTLFDALEKIGLQVDSAAVSMPVIVVDKVNPTPAPNSPEAVAAFPPSPTEFAVAEVKMTDPDFHGMNFDIQRGGRVRVRGATLKYLVEKAWGLTDDMLVGAPKFMDNDRWDIVAEAPDMARLNYTDVDAVLQMVKTLLAERFGLVTHTEARSIPTFQLTTSKPKVKRADPASRAGCKEGPPTLVKMDPRSANPALGRLFSCTNTTMAYLAEQLQYLASDYVHSAVVDSTGLEGGWDFMLSFSSLGQLRGGAPQSPGGAASTDPNGAVSLQDAMEKQLGLKLDRVRHSLPVLVIDHISEKPTDN